MDEFDQASMPVDVVQVLCALTSTSRLVPYKTPLPETGAKWKQQVDNLLEAEHHAFYVSLDDVLSTTQRLHKLGTDAVILVPRLEILGFWVLTYFKLKGSPA